jgi:hypothetical protein
LPWLLGQGMECIGKCMPKLPSAIDAAGSCTNSGCVFEMVAKLKNGGVRGGGIGCVAGTSVGYWTAWGRSVVCHRGLGRLRSLLGGSEMQRSPNPGQEKRLETTVPHRGRRHWTQGLVAIGDVDGGSHAGFLQRELLSPSPLWRHGEPSQLQLEQYLPSTPPRAPGASAILPHGAIGDTRVHRLQYLIPWHNENV